MYMAAYAYGNFQPDGNGPTIWMLKRQSDGYNWISPTEGTPLGPDSGYLRVTAISCFGCNFPSDQQWNCGDYMPANGATTFPPPPNDFTIPGKQGEEDKLHFN